jgi:hypothetical protein
VSWCMLQRSLVGLHLDLIDGVLLQRLGAALQLGPSLRPKSSSGSLRRHSSTPEWDLATSRVCIRGSLIVGVQSELQGKRELTTGAPRAFDVSFCRHAPAPDWVSSRHHALLRVAAPSDPPCTSGGLAMAHNAEPAPSSRCLATIAANNNLMRIHLLLLSFIFQISRCLM